MRASDRSFRWLIVGPVLLYAGLLLMGPLVAVVAGAFAEGIGALVRRLSAPDAVHALELTLLIAAGATVFNAVLGVLVANVLVRDSFPGRRFLDGLVDLPFAVSPVIAGFMIILLFGRDGWLTPLADAAGIKFVFSIPGMFLATAFVSLPFTIREVMPVLEQHGRHQEDAALTMGASPWQAFRRVTLPGIRWGILYGISLTFARAIGEFGAVLVVSGSVAGLTETSTLFIFRSLDERDAVGAHGMAFVLAAVSFTLLMAMEIVRRRGAGQPVKGEGA
ncbi:MAG TPA: sulfate ABC transporter permease subunit [Gemmatimonadota bacterium]|nr:sulfate ABC transporter permease subunit [Gemmatimonadota bacterium]